jgi:nitronate monooxygenase
VCAGAGGHTGFLSPFAFVSAVREFFDGYVITGGGIGDGWGVAGAVASGADLVYMGTRFIPTAESMAPPEYKQMVVDSGIDDLVVSAGVTGTAASWLKPSLRAQGLDPDNMPDAPGRQYDSNQSFTGKKWTEVWAAGQGLGPIKSVASVASVVDELARDYQQALNRFKQLPWPGAGDQHA